jgi:hypothetical protein
MRLVGAPLMGSAFDGEDIGSRDGEVIAMFKDRADSKPSYRIWSSGAAAGSVSSATAVAQ